MTNFRNGGAMLTGVFTVYRASPCEAHLAGQFCIVLEDVASDRAYDTHEAGPVGRPSPGSAYIGRTGGRRTRLLRAILPTRNSRHCVRLFACAAAKKSTVADIQSRLVPTPCYPCLRRSIDHPWEAVSCRTMRSAIPRRAVGAIAQPLRSRPGASRRPCRPCPSTGAVGTVRFL